MSFFSRFALFIGLCFSLGTAQAVTCSAEKRFALI